MKSPPFEALKTIALDYKRLGSKMVPGKLNGFAMKIILF